MTDTMNQTSKVMMIALGTIFGSSPTFAASLLTIVHTDNGVILRWQGPGVLQSAGNLSGGWADLPRAVASLTISATNTVEFFRVREPAFRVVDTGQTNCYGNSSPIATPAAWPRAIKNTATT